jgi:CD36 family
MPNLSNGRSENDSVRVPNIPLLAALTKAKDLNSFEEMAFKGILSLSNPKEFHVKTVNEFLYGYTDRFIETTPNLDAKRAGLLASRKGWNGKTFP